MTELLVLDCKVVSVVTKENFGFFELNYDLQKISKAITKMNELKFKCEIVKKRGKK